MPIAFATTRVPPNAYLLVPNTAGLLVDCAACAPKLARRTLVALWWNIRFKKSEHSNGLLCTRPRRTRKAP